MAKVVGHNRRALQDWDFDEMVDAKEDLPVAITARTSRGAEPKNCNNCVITRAATKGMGYDKARVVRNFAYLLKNKIVTRYALSATARVAVMQFDKKGVWPVLGDMLYVILRKPPRHQAMEYRRTEQYKRRRKQHNKDTRARQKAGTVRPQRKTDGIDLESWRHGLGMRFK